MNKRYKITKLDSQQTPLLTLDQCKAFFATQSDFNYMDSFTASSSEGVHMTIKGDFFMWAVGEVQVPFRFFDGEVYVAASNPIILEKIKEVAAFLEADYIEG